MPKNVGISREMARRYRKHGGDYSIKVFTDPLTGKRRTRHINKANTSSKNNSSNLNRISFNPITVRHRNRRNRRNRRYTRRLH